MSIVAPTSYNATTPSASFTGYEQPIRMTFERIVEDDPGYRRADEVIRSFLDQDEDWDGEDGVPAPESVVCLARSIVRETAIIARESNVRWVRPSVSLLNDGSVGLFWENPQVQSYIVVGPGDDDVEAVFKADGDDAVRFTIPRIDWAAAIRMVTMELIFAGR